ncbi:alpha/beta hydrolase family protein [Massilia alkalitolerans]|uniref:alpha/beta hydrolase family protein n=1 Tax=Massilia alkalitolerans TaxID=286638 RepID=UPI0028ACF207|nr:alpha/beta hydrolase [Massilia alkalitolerans]
MNSLLVRLAASLVLVACAPMAFAESTIKRYLFSMQKAEDVRTELGKMNVQLSKKWTAPARGQPMRITEVGSSGFPTSFLIEQAGGGFHVYAERRRPQNPAAPLPYVTQEVVFDTPDPEVSPVGTLSYPATGGPFPGVVLLAGTGPHDRDGGMSLHKTLAVLADHLTRQGFAVLRYDKRGVGLTGGRRHPDSTTDDYAADALAAVRFLKIQPNVRASRIGIVGHSEGGIIASMVAAQAPADVRFIVMLGGTGLPGIDIKSLQDAAARRVEGMDESLVLLNRSQERELLEIAASGRTRPDALAAMRAATHALPAATRTALEIPPEGIPDEAFEALLTPWFRRFLSLDPRLYLNRVTCPVLALGGEKDLQVPPAENLEEIERALAGRSPQSVVRQLPGLNHSFQTARTGKASEYFLIEETVAPSALAFMSTWMKKVVGHE